MLKTSFSSDKPRSRLDLIQSHLGYGTGDTTTSLSKRHFVHAPSSCLTQTHDSPPPSFDDHLPRLGNQFNWVRALVFHPGGKYLLSVSDDKTLRCWDLAQEGKCVKKLEDVHTHFVSCLRWAPAIVKDAPAATNGENGPNGISNPQKAPAGSDAHSVCDRDGECVPECEDICELRPQPTGCCINRVPQTPPASCGESAELRSK